jgi:hypothetical protein
MKLNCIYEGQEGNQVVVCVIKKIARKEELLAYYHLNRIETSTNSVWVLMQHIFKQPILIALYFFVSLTMSEIFYGPNFIIMREVDRGKVAVVEHVND